MLVLLTNDDGFDSPGLGALASALAPGHDLVVVAPETDRSGSAQSITLGRSVDLRERAPNRWLLAGTPADCVRFGLRTLCGEAKPACVISGINHGANLGTDIHLSGTVGAARHAAMMGFPALAVSVAGTPGLGELRLASAFVAAHLGLFLECLQPGLFLNVNIPTNTPLGVRITRPGVPRYIGSIEEVPPRPGYDRGLAQRLRPDPDALLEGDCEALADGFLSIGAFGLWGPDPGLEKALHLRIDDLGFNRA